ncbi:NAD(P)H-binding protein [Geoalkalibacter subterraneus]|jgi:nucleoside-diphosphate-sugar epimerase|uniref:NAD(P)H-binding protein n=1 Tax=Geoalkalibacter subterraneus TaxID=483547 RepID=UPI000694BDFE|nr:NAD(P)H-binding protein [Geoalkalibacter subterraneus]
MNGVFIVGCGGLGRKVAALWREKGERVAALVRSPTHAEKLKALGMEVVEGDLDWPESLKDLSLNEKLVYYFAPPPSTGIEDSRMKSFCNTVLAHQKPERLVYVSTSGVYGNRNGAWVDESASLAPATDRAHRRVSVEQTPGSSFRSQCLPRAR